MVNDTVTWPFDFLGHNRKLRENIEAILTRTRDGAYQNIDEALYRFYAARLSDVSAVADLVDLVRERRAKEPRFLMLELSDLRDPETFVHDTKAYPAQVPLDNRALPLHYAYKPGKADDGVSVEIPVGEAADLTPQAIDWAVPGHLEAKVEHYLRALPKDFRVSFIPLAENARKFSEWISARDRLTSRRETVAEALAAEIRERFKLPVFPDVWEGKAPPDHLRVRIVVVDANGESIASSREIPEVMAQLAARDQAASKRVATADPGAWGEARAKWEKPPQLTWAFGTIPERVTVLEKAGIPIYAYPGLVTEEKGVALRLFRTADEAAEASTQGTRALIDLILRYELGWLERDLRAIADLGPLISTLAPGANLRADLFASLHRWVCGHAVRPLSEAGFKQALDQARLDLRGLVPRTVELLREILNLRQALLVVPQPYPGLEQDLLALVGPTFLRDTPYERLAHLPRYLKAMRVRAERWKQNPAKDAERVRQIAPYVAAARKAAPAGFRWSVEEFRVSLFAQELGTAEQVSAVKLDRILQGGGAVPAAATAAAPAEGAPKPAVVALPVTKQAPLKSLNALNKLFPR